MVPRNMLLVVGCGVLATTCLAGEPLPLDFLALSLEQLGSVQVTSVSKKSERLADAAAAIYVITNDDIRRAGAHTLPEALRLAPNLQVAQINASQYAISARGFNSSTANKLLVMIDGRSIYTPLYSGVFWDAQDILLPDIDRIEVISGPGGTLWGANAVNGVINIITRRAASSSGSLVQVLGGNAMQALAVRHGGDLGSDNAAYRVYAKFDRRRHTTREDGSRVLDGIDRSQVGFRTDWQQGGGDVQVQGDAYRDTIEMAGPEQQKNTGANLLARGVWSLADGSSLRVQTYYDRTTRDTPGSYNEKLDTLDLDVQYSLAEENGSQLICGGGYRFSDDRIGNSATLAFLPAHRKLTWTNLFVQQQRTLRDGLQLTLGIRVEHNDFTGLEYLPSAKLAWKPDEDKLLWVGLSRAVRTPSRVDTDFYAPGQPPYVLAGGPNFRSEIANTLDLGWRAQSGSAWSYTVAAFYSKYDHVRSLLTLPSRVFVLANEISGHISGLESWARYQAGNDWSLRAGMLLLRENFSGTNLALTPPGNDPHAQWRIGAEWNLGGGHELDISLRHVGNLSSPTVRRYTTGDVRYGWRASKTVELALSGQNLFGPRHREFASGSSSQRLSPIQIGRAISIAITARF